MIKSVNNYPISQLFDPEGNVVYAVPRYQREYTWGKPHWENLFDDLLENDPGYFLGSIICINQSDDAIAVQQLEVVDGQQRLTTLSLLFAAIFEAFGNSVGELDEEQMVERNNMKRKLVLRGNADQMRVVPQIQNKNQEDFRGILSEIGAIASYDMPLNAGNRRVLKGFRYFRKRIHEMVEDKTEGSASLESFVEKVNRASVVKIEVASHTDAYVLFESLNDRGIPLTAVDLIKNKLLAQIERDDAGRVDYYFDQWRNLLEDLGDEYAIHERFFRQYYNAFRDKLKAVVDVPIATRSNLIRIFEKLINHDAKDCLTSTASAGRTYSFILSRRHDESMRDLVRPLQDLERIQGSPSYVLLLNFLSRKKELQLTNQHLVTIIQTLVKFFVRRNLTDTPPTNEVTRIPLRMLEGMGEIVGNDVVEYIEKELALISSPNMEFRRRLEGPIYDENIGVARFVLAALADASMTRETMTNLWEKQNGQLKWTIEHIFPQGENIPPSWIDMIAGGDAVLAKEYQQRYVHNLGNLTITGYNSSLGNKGFEKKRDRQEAGLPVGYKNGLELNEDLANSTGWSVEQINARGAKLVARAMELFKLDGVDD